MKNVSQNWREPKMDIKQQELDMAEEYILSKLFGNATNPVISKKWETILILKNINYREKINEYLNIFEIFAKDLQKENGYFDGNKTTQLMILQFPYLQGLVLPDIRPIDFFRLVDNLIGLDKIGEIIQV